VGAGHEGYLLVTLSVESSKGVSEFQVALVARHIVYGPLINVLENTMTKSRLAILAPVWALVVVGAVFLAPSTTVLSAPAPSSIQSLIAPPATPPALSASVSFVSTTPVLSATIPTAPPASPATLVRTASPLVGQISFVTLGDSMTSGYGNRGPSWPVALDALRTDLRLVHNAGIVGYSSADMRARLSRNVYRYNPKLLLVLGGVNDLNRGASPAKVLANLEAIAVDARRHGITVVLLTIPHDSIRAIQTKINILDNGMIAYGIKSGVQVIDLRTAIKGPRGFTVDGVHFNAAGVKAAAREIAAALKI
jgi:lysophospholipase L1-like esterase